MPLNERAREKYDDELRELTEHQLGMPDQMFNVKDGGDCYAGLELASYLIWLGAVESGQVSAQALGVLVLACIGRGMWWGEVADDLGLPVPPDWEL